MAQHSRDLTKLTVELAEQASRDSASMMTIAALTMFFLPATFVSSLFSMGFFAFDNDGALRTSKKVWIYPVIVVPLTAFVFVVWSTWIKLRNKSRREARRPDPEKES